MTGVDRWWERRADARADSGPGVTGLAHAHERGCTCWWVAPPLGSAGAWRVRLVTIPREAPGRARCPVHTAPEVCRKIVERPGALVVRYAYCNTRLSDDESCPNDDLHRTPDDRKRSGDVSTANAVRAVLDAFPATRIITDGRRSP